MSRWSVVALVVLCLAVGCATADDSIADDFITSIKEVEIFKLRRSTLACPVVLVGSTCPEDNPLYYFKCCGDLNKDCCFRLQDWVMVLLIILAVCILISIVVNFIRCLCCY